ncbi:MAG: hypothetical protein WA364_17380 [Candidatus Nitrosopolaris sp.]
MKVDSSAEKTIKRIRSHKLWVIKAICINCNKRFTSMRAVSVHLKMTAARHTVNITDHGDYDRNTGLTIEEEEST